MPQAIFRFYAGLNDFLPPANRQADLAYFFELPVSVKHVIEAFGVPHPEVELILVNGLPVDFSRILQDGDHASIYPAFYSLDIAPLGRLHPDLPNPPRFVLDAHLGRLAAYLRLLGFDSLYRNDFGDEELAQISAAQGRIVLSRDRGLLKRSIVEHGYSLRSPDPRQQAREVVARFALKPLFQPFSRCLRCNGFLEPAPEEAISAQLQPGTRQHFHEYFRCQACGQVFWKGAHYERMVKLIESFSA